MKPETKEVMELVQEIRDIESEVYQLEQQKMRAVYRLDQLVISRSGFVDASAPQAGTPRRGRAASGKSAKDLIAVLINGQPERDFDAETVAKELNMNINTVKTNLSRLKGENVIAKRSSNRYGAIIGQEKEATDVAAS